LLTKIFFSNQNQSEFNSPWRAPTNPMF